MLSNWRALITVLALIPGAAHAQDYQYVRSVTTALSTLQATLYNSDRNIVSIFTFGGNGQEFTIDGQPNGTTMMAPVTARNSLDGATYDPISQRVLFLTQNCLLTEADPVTYVKVSTVALGARASICAGIALGRDNRLYVASYGTNEIISYVRSGSAAVARFSLAPHGFSGPDGISNVLGNDHFVVVSTSQNSALVVTSTGGLIRPAARVGMPPLAGRYVSPDGLASICKNGHVWVCEQYGSHCLDLQPVTGDQNSCTCHDPGSANACSGSGMAPTCDETTNQCRGCQNDTECTGGAVCDVPSGACVAPAPPDAGVAAADAAGPMADAGAAAADAAPSPLDAASAGLDAASAGLDAASVVAQVDATVARDAGGFESPDNGCGCSSGPGSGRLFGEHLALFAIFAGVWITNRRAHVGA